MGRLAAIAMTSLLGACGSCESTDAAAFRYATACQVGQDQRPAGAVRLALAFPALPRFEMPIDLTHFHDGSGRIAVAERAGRIRIVHPDGRVTTALDISAKVYTGGECGFLGIAVSPHHADDRRLFASYCIERDGETISVVAESLKRSDDRDAVDPASERTLLELKQPWDNHDGGGLAFGPDGFLYAGFGDGGSGNDPLNSGQDTQSLLGKMLRLDVAAPAPYGIPADNPFAGAPERGRPEIFAWGLRNPWRFSFDRATGKLWVGDVGQDTTEEIDVVERGKNYGWKIMEGAHCRPGGPDSCDRTGLALPVLEYSHAVGRSVTGGYVYRGQKVPALVGRYVYADYVTRVVFTWQEGEPAPKDPLLVADGAIAAFGEDEAGELYALDLEGGRIFRFEQGLEAATKGPPERLSQTHCFSDLPTLTPAEGVLPYTIALPFWSDGAEKRRFVVLPPGGRITPRSEGPFQFPVGTLFIKHFDLKVSGGGTRRLETRFLIQDELGVRGFSYRWNEAGTDATLAADGARFPVETAAGTHDWQLPSRTDCTTCHRGRGVLGLEARQLGATAQTFADLGLMQGPPPAVATHPLPSDTGATLEARARAWLHVNCAYCHDGLGPSGTPLDLRITTATRDMAACGAPPMRGDMGIPDAAVIVPGDPARSILWYRASVRDVHGMPPLATSIVDPAATLVRDWIASLASCP